MEWEESGQRRQKDIKKDKDIQRCCQVSSASSSQNNTSDSASHHSSSTDDTKSSSSSSVDGQTVCLAVQVHPCSSSTNSSSSSSSSSSLSSSSSDSIVPAWCSSDSIQQFKLIKKFVQAHPAVLVAHLAAFRWFHPVTQALYAVHNDSIMNTAAICHCSQSNPSKSLSRTSHQSQATAGPLMTTIIWIWPGIWQCQRHSEAFNFLWL